MVPIHLSDEDSQSSTRENKRNEENDTSSDETSKSILSPSDSTNSRAISPSNLSSCSDRESVDNNNYNLREDKHNIFPINLSDRGVGDDKSYKSFIPRTVPCVVLAQSNESLNPNLFQMSPNYRLPPSPLESIMTKISKLSNPDSSYFNRIFTTNVSSRVDNSYDASSKAKSEGQKDLGNNQLDDSTQTFGKLSFGIDRILSQDFNRKQDELEGSNNKPQDPDLIVRAHQHHPNSISPCSDCFLLSRFYRYQMSASNRSYSAAASSWPQHQHIFDASGSLLSPGGGYTHHQHSPLPQFGINISGYSSISPMVSCNSHSNPRRKRSWSRAVFSNLQRKGLEKRFQIQKYITKPDRRQLAATLGLTDAQVKVWFQNRRMKWRHTKEGKSGLTESSSSNSNSKFSSQSASIGIKK